MKEGRISDVVNDLIENIDALNESAPLALSVVSTLAIKMSKAYGDYIKKYGEVEDKDGNTQIYIIPIERQGRVNRLRDQW